MALTLNKIQENKKNNLNLLILNKGLLNQLIFNFMHTSHEIFFFQKDFFKNKFHVDPTSGHVGNRLGMKIWRIPAK